MRQILLLLLSLMLAGCELPRSGTRVGLDRIDATLDDVAAQRLLAAASEASDATSGANLGAMLFSRQRTPEQRREGVRRMREAAAHGDATGQLNYGVFCLRFAYRMGRECGDRDAARLFKAAMDQGHPRGMIYYGYMLELGAGGVPEDDAAARTLYRRALAAGDKIAEMFLDGHDPYWGSDEIKEGLQ